MKLTTVFIYFLAGIWLNSFSQPNLHFNYLTVEQGLPSNSVSAIYQDHLGFMWIGSLGEGISRYDGYNFKTYESVSDNPLTLSNNSISVIREDSNHNLWIGTWNGVSLYNREQEIFTRFLTSPDNTMNIFHSIFEDSQRRIWIGGDELYQFQPSDSSFRVIQRSANANGSLAPGRVREILEDRTNQLWVATSTGLNLYHDETGHFSIFPAPPELTDQIRSVCQDHLGRFWISTFQAGVWLFDPKNQSFVDFYEQATIYGAYNEFSVAVYDIIQDERHNIWAITDGSGLLLLEPNSTSIYTYRYDPILNGALSDDNLISIYLDHQNNLWVGSYNTGLSILNSGQAYLKRYYHNPSDPNSLSSNLVTGVYEDKQGDLWVTTDGGGVNWLKLDQNGAVVSNTILRSSGPIIPNDKIMGLVQAQDGWIWINTQAGSVRLNPETMKFSPKPSLIFQDTRSDYWFQEEKRLVEQDIKTGESLFYETSLIYPRFQEDQSGNLWIADWSQGLKFIEKGSGLVISKISGMMSGICEDKNGALWVATMKDGLIKYDPKTDQITRFNRERGFMTDDCRGGLLRDHNDMIWIGSNEGIIRFNPETLEMINFGLINENLKHYIKPLAQTSDGKIYLGSSRGMIAFHPDSIEIPAIPPQPLFTSFLLFGKDLPVGKNSVLHSNILDTDEISLSHKQNVFTLEYASLSFQPTQTIYSYKLDGYDEEWRNVGTSRSATYTNLDPGSYQLKVRVGNLNGDWNPEEATMQINVLPPPWKTWWAYSLYMAAFGCMLLVWRSQLVRRERLKTKLQLEHLELKKVKELDQLKTRFFTNISHEFRTPLTLILGPLEQMYEDSFNGNTREVMAVMLRNSKRLLNLINQLLDFSKLDAGGVNLQASQEEMVQFTRTLFSGFESAAKSRQISYTFQSNREVITCYIDPDLMEKVIINLLSNAFKFTPEKGSIVVKLNTGDFNPEVDRGAGVLEICVEDTGQGIEANKIPFVFDRFYQSGHSNTRLREGTGIGLALTKELVELHHGNILVKSAPGVHTSFIVHIPLGSSHLSDGEMVIRQSYHVTDTSLLEIWPLKDSNGSDEKYSQENLPLVLIVEDNQDMRLYLREILGEYYHLEEADNGDGGLEIALAEIPEVIISDVMMPEMDGYELCRQIKADERTSHIPVVLLTARAGEEAKIKGLETGADDYITKPFSPLELRVRVRNLIENRKLLAAQYRSTHSIYPTVGPINSLDDRFLKRVTQIVDQHRSDADYTIEEFAREIGMSRSQLHRKLKALTGQTATDFIRTYRLKYSRMLMEQDYDNIAQIAYECGFKNPSYFTECFKKQFGVLPSEFAKAKTKE